MLVYRDDFGDAKFNKLQTFLTEYYGVAKLPQWREKKKVRIVRFKSARALEIVEDFNKFKI